MSRCATAPHLSLGPADTAGAVAAIQEVSETSIGHFPIGQSVFEGLPAAVRRMEGIIAAARVAG